MTADAVTRAQQDDETLLDALQVRLHDAIETAMWAHEAEDRDSRCTCGVRNNMDGDVLAGHRVTAVAASVWSIVEGLGLQPEQLLHHDEVWKRHPTFTFLEISDHGRVKRLATETSASGERGDYSFWNRDLILRIRQAANGYLETTIYDAEKKQGTRKRVHVLVCETFHGPKPSSKHEVRHLNGDRTDARASNLAWGTRSENMQDALRHGTHPVASKTHCKYGHEFTPENTVKGPRNSRGCRICTARRNIEGHRRYRAKQRALKQKGAAS